MQKNVLIILALTLCCSLGPVYAAGKEKPTVTVVDAQTGEPVEGAVAIAIWRKHSSTKRAWWEGGTEVVSRIEEAVSDKDGHIYIDGFWGWFGTKARLSIYKFGYVLWDSKNIFKTPGYRTDFDKKHRTVRLDTWPDNFSFIRHSRFKSFCTDNDDHSATGLLFTKAFAKEIPYRSEERTKLDASKNVIVEEAK